MIDYKLIPYDEWEENYIPVENKYGSIAFDTHSKEDLKFLQENQYDDALNIWTLVDGDDGKLYIDSGYRFVNRMEYYITQIPRESVNQIVQVEY